MPRDLHTPPSTRPGIIAEREWERTEQKRESQARVVAQHTETRRGRGTKKQIKRALPSGIEAKEGKERKDARMHTPREGGGTM